MVFLVWVSLNLKKVRLVRSKSILWKDWCTTWMRSQLPPSVLILQDLLLPDSIEL